MPLYAIGDHRPTLESDDVWVAPSADVMGRVVLKKGANIWFNATLRGDDNAGLVLDEDFSQRVGSYGFPKIQGISNDDYYDKNDDDYYEDDYYDDDDKYDDEDDYEQVHDTKQAGDAAGHQCHRDR